MTIELGTEKDFELVYADMLRQFPPNEMKSKEAFLELLRGGDYDLGLVRDNTRQVLAYFMCYRIKGFKFGLLDHFAVLKEFQNKGIGRQALDAIVEYYRNLKGLILEVERPNILEPDTIRRVRFYKRAGAYMLDIRYILPGNPSFIPMELMFLNCGKSVGRIDILLIKSALKVVFDTVHAGFANAKDVWAVLKRSWSGAM